MVDPSPWPLLCSLGAFLMALGTVLAVNDHGSITLIVGTVLTMGTLVFWWRDVIQESKDQHTSRVRLGFQYGMALFILSEVMFFASFFWAYFDAAINPPEVMGGVWPPQGIKTMDPFDLPYLNTLLLLFSGTTLTWSHYRLLEEEQEDSAQKLLLTTLIGVIFLGVQALEYLHAPFAFKDGVYPSTFYMATGFHGFHVLVGTIFLFVCWKRMKNKHFTAKDHFGFEAAAWYWHFVDVVWLFLFVAIYWWGS